MTDTNYLPTSIRLAHRGYEASAVVDPTDGYLQGMVEGLEQDLLSFDGDDIAELAANFKTAVDEYLEDCAERGVEAEKPKISAPA
ncbi:hypothetical protein [cf. Phormidesmis sp. LEGE 11477]|uniref:hypothetical protein n=1 Tax=cf. Phormidesmis sp. LEGE 11477 TaxID=1828680 RepID=UPI001881D638|nr:hypothetical protein [cf. Phormidesmis sp. LEGE 11477]MBE9063564.1 hypothetical protein [cf. Phormidesmis sp. LEGE 11477]